MVGAGTSVLTSVGLQLTFVNIFSAKLAWCTERNRFYKSSCCDTRRFQNRQHNKKSTSNWLSLLILGTHRKTQAWELPIVLLSNYTSQLTSLHSPKEGVNCKLAGKVTGREPEDSLQHIYRYIWEDLKMQQPEGLRRREPHSEGNILANSKVTVSRTHFSYIITPWILLYKDESLRFLYLKYSFSSSQFPHTASFFYFYFLKPIPKNPTTSLIK